MTLPLQEIIYDDTYSLPLSKSRNVARIPPPEKEKEINCFSYDFLIMFTTHPCSV